jgi:hypothetical protein
MVCRFLKIKKKLIALACVWYVINQMICKTFPWEEQLEHKPPHKNKMDESTTVFSNTALFALGGLFVSVLSIGTKVPVCGFKPCR